MPKREMCRHKRYVIRVLSNEGYRSRRVSGGGGPVTLPVDLLVLCRRVLRSRLRGSSCNMSEVRSCCKGVSSTAKCPTYM